MFLSIVCLSTGVIPNVTITYDPLDLYMYTGTPSPPLTPPLPRPAPLPAPDMTC